MSHEINNQITNKSTLRATTTTTTMSSGELEHFVVRIENDPRARARLCECFHLLDNIREILMALSSFVCFYLCGLIMCRDSCWFTKITRTQARTHTFDKLIHEKWCSMPVALYCTRATNRDLFAYIIIREYL